MSNGARGLPSPTIIFVRHGEKSRHSGGHLSRVGQLRARFLADYFLHPFDDFPRPRELHAMTLSGRGRSRRCEETLWPTAGAGALTLDLVPRHRTEAFAEELARRANACDSQSANVVLVCWEHSRIVDMVNVIAGRPEVPAVRSWGLDPRAEEDDKECFDATWVCTFDATSFSRTMTLTVFKQFDVVGGQPYYRPDCPRNRVWYRETFALDRDAAHPAVFSVPCVVS